MGLVLCECVCVRNWHSIGHNEMLSRFSTHTPRQRGAASDLRDSAIIENCALIVSADNADGFDGHFDRCLEQVSKYRATLTQSVNRSLSHRCVYMAPCTDVAMYTIRIYFWCSGSLLYQMLKSSAYMKLLECAWCGSATAKLVTACMVACLVDIRLNSRMTYTSAPHSFPK